MKSIILCPLFAAAFPLKFFHVSTCNSVNSFLMAMWFAIDYVEICYIYYILFSQPYTGHLFLIFLLVMQNKSNS